MGEGGGECSRCLACCLGGFEDEGTETSTTLRFFVGEGGGDGESAVVLWTVSVLKTVLGVLIVFLFLVGEGGGEGDGSRGRVWRFRGEDVAGAGMGSAEGFLRLGLVGEGSSTPSKMLRVLLADVELCARVGLEGESMSSSSDESSTSSTTLSPNKSTSGSFSFSLSDPEDSESTGTALGGRPRLA